MLLNSLRDWVKGSDAGGVCQSDDVFVCAENVSSKIDSGISIACGALQLADPTTWTTSDATLVDCSKALRTLLREVLVYCESEEVDACISTILAQLDQLTENLCMITGCLLGSPPQVDKVFTDPVVDSFCQDPDFLLCGAAVERPAIPGHEVNPPGEMTTLTADVGIDLSGSVEDELLAKESCTYSRTAYFDGGRGEGDDAIYGVDKTLGVYALAHADTGWTHYSKRNSTAWARGGHVFKWNGQRSINATIHMPWKVLGEMTTVIDRMPQPGCKDTLCAEAAYVVRLGVHQYLNGSTTNLHSEIVSDVIQLGNSRKIWRDSGNRGFQVTMYPGYTYIPYIRIYSRGTVERSWQEAAKNHATATSNFFNVNYGYRAKLAHVKYQFARRVICS